jgi:hypothetical protein
MDRLQSPNIIRTEKNWNKILPSLAAVAIQSSPLDLWHCTAIGDAGGASGLTFWFCTLPI